MQAADQTIDLIRLTLQKAGEAVRESSTDSEVVAQYESWRSRQTEADAQRREKAKSEAADRERRRQIEIMQMRLARHGINTGDLDDAEQFAAAAKLLQELDRKAREKAGAEAVALAERQRRRLAEKLFKQANCPARHVANLDQLQDRQQWNEVRDLLIDRADDGWLIALLGKRGVGKTELAVSVIHRLCEVGKSARYCKLLDLAADVRSTYTPTTRDEAHDSEADRIEYWSTVDALVMDEIHQRSGSEFETNLLIRIIDRRYDARRCTLLIGNQTPEQFAQAAGDSIISRLHESGEVIELTGPSFRVAGTWRAEA